jgi:hypothetical protein
MRFQIWKSWRLLLLVPAILLFAAMVQEVVRYREVSEKYARLGIQPDKVPPTAFGEHSGLAIAYGAMSLIFVVLALRSRRPLE